MELYVEVAPKTINSFARTHKVDLPDVASFKRYARGLFTGRPHNEPFKRPSTQVARTRPAWVIIKSNSALSSDTNVLFFVGFDLHDGYLQPIEKTYNPSFTEGQQAPKPLDNKPKA